jgi:hypothetical protein
MFKDYRGWELVEEEMIKAAAAVAIEENSEDVANFKRILAAGEVFRFAGLTPVFVYDDNSSRMAVYAEELYGRKLH